MTFSYFHLILNNESFNAIYSSLKITLVVVVSLLSRVCRVWLLQPHGLWPTRLLCPRILQVRILEWVATSFSRGSFWPRNQTQVSWIAGRFFTNWTMKITLSLYITPMWLLPNSCHSILYLGKYNLSPWASMMAQMVKNPPAMQKTWVQSLCREDPLEMGMATHSSILSWRIPWTEVSGSCSPWGCKESDMTEQPNNNVSLS